MLGIIPLHVNTNIDDLERGSPITWPRTIQYNSSAGRSIEKKKYIRCAPNCCCSFVVSLSSSKIGGATSILRTAGTKKKPKKRHSRHRVRGTAALEGRGKTVPGSTRKQSHQPRDGLHTLWGYKSARIVRIYMYVWCYFFKKTKKKKLFFYHITLCGLRVCWSKKGVRNERA